MIQSSTGAVATAGAVFAAVWLAARPARNASRRIGSSAGGLPTGRSLRRTKPVMMAVLALALVKLLQAQGPRVLVLGVGAVAVSWAAQHLIASWRTRALQTRRRGAVVEFCDALAAELEAGLPAVTAMERACAPWPELAGVVNATRLGDDVAAALRRTAASMPGAEGLRSVAAAWDVAARSGAGLAVVLGRVAAGLRSDEEARAEVTAALGPPRATAKMLAVLPLFGIALGISMGAHPVGFLLQTGAGVSCLAIGTALALAGLWWVERLASAAEA